MKKIFTAALLAIVAAGCTTTTPAPEASAAKPKKDAYDIRPQDKGSKYPTSQAWQADNREKLDKETSAAACAEVLSCAKKADKLLGAVKTGYQTCPMAAEKIAAVTQYVMTPAGAAKRDLWADALFTHAQAADKSDVACWYLDQLRWCGRADQAEAVRSWGASHKCKKCVGAFSVMVADELAGVAAKQQFAK